jgi:hypothetical protein
VREMSIGGENYARSIIPVRSDISRFSRGIIEWFQFPGAEEAAALCCSLSRKESQMPDREQFC